MVNLFHARTSCDGCSDCARGRNNPRYAGARNGGRISLVDRNPQGATETSLPATARCNAANPTSEKPKFGRGSAQGKSKLREPASAEINCRPRHNMAMLRPLRSSLTSSLQPIPYQRLVRALVLKPLKPTLNVSINSRPSPKASTVWLRLTPYRPAVRSAS